MDLKNVKTLEQLKQAKNKFFGEDSEFKKLQLELRITPRELKGVIGKKLQLMKVTAEKAFSEKMLEIEERKIIKQMENEWIDVSQPQKITGSLHPLTLIEIRIRDWFVQNGYLEEFGNEIESDLYNFERLNISKEHPARDMQDSLYLDKNTLLRTHNTGLSARFLEENANQQVSSFTVGKVYRNDEDDATHSHQFTQLDFVSVGDLSFPNLIWTLKSMLSYVFEQKVEIRLRPSYFPFTEPSAEVDVLFKKNWIEILGTGMLNKNVLKLAGYTNQMNAFAGGVGIERLAMIKYGINDIREFYKNDLRFLNQFKEVS